MTIKNGEYSVYVHLNKTNGKCYVGITCKEPYQRWGSNGIGYKTQRYIWRAIQKYGWDGFEHFIFARNLTEEEACNMEIILIKKLRSNIPKYGYNYESGGRCHSVESRRKIGDSEKGNKHHYYGKKRSAETRKKISDSLSGEKHPWFGKHQPESTKRKISKSRSGIPKAPGAGLQQIPVICVETGVEYKSMTEASKHTGAPRNTIGMVQNGKRQTSGGFHWKLKENSEVS